MSIVKTVVTKFRNSFHNITNFNKFNNPFMNIMHFSQPEFALAGISNETSKELSNEQNKNIDLKSLLEGIWLMAVPKSKISRSRKRMKHMKYVPDPVTWHMCEKCGEPKRPHRICTKHIDVCALRKEDWEKVKQAELAAQAQSELDR